MLVKTKEIVFKFIEPPKNSFGAFIPEVCITVEIMGNDRMKIRTVAEFISALLIDADCRSSFASVGKLNIHFNVDSGVVLVLVSPMYGVSQPVVCASIRPGFSHLCHYSILAGHPGELRMYDSTRMKLYWTHIVRQ